MIGVKKINLILILVILFLVGCIYVPKFEKNKNEHCELITKSMTIENEVKYSGGCEGRCAELALGVAATTFIVSGSIVAVGNTVHWIEKMGRCEDSSIQEEINKLYKKTFAAGGYILKTSDDFMNWIKGNDQTDSRTKE